MISSQYQVLFDEWSKCIPRADRSLSRTDRVCEQHFDQTFVIRHFDLTGPDGVKSLLERERPKLTSTAVPSIFPNLPKYLTRIMTKRKAPTVRNALPKKVKKNVSKYLSKDSGGFDFNRDAKNVKSPCTMWGMHYNIDTIINSHIENNQYIPLVFTLLNDKNQESCYTNAIYEVWPLSEIRGCRFHLGQSWYRKIQKLGLSTECEQKTEIGEYLVYHF
ncbi:THAP domain-containing protein 5 [Aphis craccivora]|uniref:THAP domain-containing protein 5 n=1 Tax=Aphis craccivora TaxID=307492 RepID=A0A6G0ZR30_APHCR|nr:THAP domain-containing protein 5 [Aphis craccivora]